MIGALWVGTRQFVHERSGLPPPSLASPSFTLDDPVRTTQHLLDRVYSLIPPAFRPSHIAPLAPPPIIQGCFRNHITPHSSPLNGRVFQFITGTPQSPPMQWPLNRCSRFFRLTLLSHGLCINFNLLSHGLPTVIYNSNCVLVVAFMVTLHPLSTLMLLHPCL